MNWYYVDAGKQTGPVDDAQLQQLASSGTIQPETLVWREGLANWQAYREVMGGNPAMPSAPPVAGPTPGGTAPNEVVCAECGKIFDVSNTIAYGNLRVCAACKPVFVQKLAEGAKLNTAAMNYAGFWTRFGAVFVDGILLFVLNTGMNLIAGVGVTGGGRGSGQVLVPVILFFIQIGIAIGYETFMIGKYGATLGKMACKIKVVTADGGQVTYLRAFGRYWAKQLSAIICLAGYIMAAFDDERRGLHDRICNTRVVFK